MSERLPRRPGPIRACPTIDAFARPGVFAAAVLAYYLAAAAIRSLVLTGSSGDEAQLMLYAQVFARGYDLVNLPMKGWLGALVEALFGPGLGVALGVRYGLLAAFFIVGHAVAREALGDPRLALAAAIAPVGFFFIGWESLRNFADSLVMIVVLTMTIGMVLRLARSPTSAGFGILGAVMAVGLLAKYTYPVALAVLVIAGLATPGLRQVFTDRRFVLAAVAALAAAVPAYLWALGRLDALGRMVDARLVQEAGNTLGDAWQFTNLLTAGDAAAGFVLPLLPLFLVIFGADYVRRWAHRAPPAVPSVARWLGLYLALLLAASTLVAAAAGLERIREHYMFVLVPLPLWLAALLPADVGIRRISAFVGTNVVLAVAALGALLGQAAVADDCGKCRLLMPWKDYAAQLRAIGFERGTIVSFDSPYTDIGPNLRRFLPDTRVWSTKRPYVRAKPVEPPGSCLVVWNDTREPHVLDLIRRAAIPGFDFALPPDARVGRLEAPLAWSAEPAPAVGYALIEQGEGSCR